MATTSYRLRGFDRSNPRDIELVNLMRFHPSVMKAKGYWEHGFNYAHQADLTEISWDWLYPKMNLKKEYDDIWFIVADYLNRAVGWVWFYHDSHPLPKKIVSELGLTPRNSRVYQISYEKLMSGEWPSELVAKAQHVTLGYLSQRRKGVIVEGLRLAIGRMQRMYRKLYVVKRKLVLYAYVHPKNVASAKVLMYNGFARMERKYRYDSSLYHLWVKVV